MGVVSREAILLSGIFAGFLFLLCWLNRNGRTFFNDSEGLTIDEFAAVSALPLWIYVGISMALNGPNITEVEVDFFEVLSWVPVATIAKQAVARFGFPGKRGSKAPDYGGYGGYGGGYEGEDYAQQPPERRQP